MARKLGIVFAIFALVGAAAGGFVLHRLNGTYGLFPAQAVSHESLATADTRLRISVDTLRLGQDLLPYLPENPPLPGWLPWDLPGILPKVMPRELALLGGSDFAASLYNLTLFVNEQRGGPALPDYLNNRARILQQVPAVTWDGEGFQLKSRGVLMANGHFQLPLGLENEILAGWSLDGPDIPLALAGGHLAEGVIDNRNGEVVTLIGGLAPMWGSSLDRIKADSRFAAVFALLLDIHHIRLAVDFKNVDTLLLQFRLHADQAAGGQLEFMLPLLIGMFAPQVEAQYGLKLEGDYAWNPAEEIYRCDISIVGVEARLRAYFRNIVPAAAAPPSAGEER